MAGVATPDAKQSEAYIATVALFHIFSSNAREEKVNLRLPPTWKDLWSELAEAKKNHADAANRTVVKGLRSLVRERLDQELEDGVIIQGAFRGRGNTKQQSEATDQNGHRNKQNNGNADLLRKIWADKSSTSKFQSMLVSMLSTQLPSCCSQVCQDISHATPYMEFQIPSFRGCCESPSRHRMR